MMAAARELDGMLAAWGEHVFNGGAVRKIAARRGLTGLMLQKSVKVNRAGSVSAQAEAVRRKLIGITSGE
jgi:hypothetical protein